MINVKRDSTDKTCLRLFNDFYDSFESDEGLTNSKMTQATIKLFQYQSDSTLTNRQLAILLYQYTMSSSEPDKAVIWIQALKDEYSRVYRQINPLILLYQGETLINAGKNADAYKHFIDFQKQFPKSVMALVYIYQTEKDNNLAKTWLSVLKAEHPNHWVVKNLK